MAVFGKLYDQKQTGTMAHKNLMVYRYAEMLLLMADVYNELGDTPKAISLANEVLARARKSGTIASAQPADWPSSLTKDRLRRSCILNVLSNFAVNLIFMIWYVSVVRNISRGSWN